VTQSYGATAKLRHARRAASIDRNRSLAALFYLVTLDVNRPALTPSEGIPGPAGANRLRVFRIRIATGHHGTPLLREPVTWMVVGACWGIFGVGSGLLDYGLSVGSADHPVAPSRVAPLLVHLSLWAGVTPVAVWTTDRFALLRPRPSPAALLHLLAGTAVALTCAIVAYAITRVLIPGWMPWSVPRMVAITSLAGFFYYMGTVCLLHGILFAREHRSREMEARARELAARAHEAETLRETTLSSETQLQLLKMELQPHFLFNALHAVSALMHRDVRSANQMLVLLADMLQGALESVRAQEVSLQEELASLQPYLQLQQIRFGDHLDVVWSIAPDTHWARVPHMILQPLVENSIKHGLAHRTAGGKVEVSAWRTDEWLHLAVRDDGITPRRLPPRPGVGLSNIIARLVHLYGEEQNFELAAAPGGGTVATVSIPFRETDRSRLSAA
jgi:signal transduction histidine kinase